MATVGPIRGVSRDRGPDARGQRLTGDSPLAECHLPLKTESPKVDSGLRFRNCFAESGEIDRKARIMGGLAAAQRAS